MRWIGLPFFLFAAGVFAAETSAPADSVLPSARPFARYETLIKKSPFAPATPITPVTAAPGFAVNYYVAGVAKIGTKDFVTIASRDGQTRFSGMPGEPGPDGIQIMRVDWSDEPGKSKVTMKKGNETGVAEFDQAMLQRPAGPVAQVPIQPANNFAPQPVRTLAGLRGVQVQPNQAPQNQTSLQAPSRPNYGQPAVAPTLPASQLPPPNGQPDTRRRIRIINSRPQ